MGERWDVFRIDEAAKPYTHLCFKNDPDEFQFAIITDKAGGARPGVFSRAVEMVNLLQPEFVVNAGDLIEGYSEDPEQIRAWWQEIDEFLEPLETPFFSCRAITTTTLRYLSRRGASALVTNRDTITLSTRTCYS